MSDRQPLQDFSIQLEQSWERDREILRSNVIDSERASLFRPGYCCGERCQDCPYFNWTNQMPWYPPPEEAIKSHAVPTLTLSVLRGRRALALLFLRKGTPEEVEYYQILLHYYSMLAERWLADANK